MYKLIEETPIADIIVEISEDIEFIKGRKEALENVMPHTYRIKEEK